MEWWFDLASVQDSSALSVVDNMPLFSTVPLYAPRFAGQVLHHVVYDFKSQDGVKGTITLKPAKTLVYDSVAISVHYHVNSESAHVATTTTARLNGLRLVELPLKPITFATMATIDLAARRRAYQTHGGNWTSNPPSEGCVASAILPDDISTLIKHVMRLVCSETPTSFRSLERPDDPLASPLPLPTDNLSTLPRRWSWSRGAILKNKTAPRLADSDSSEEISTPEQRWRAFVAAVRSGQRVEVEIDFQSILGNLEDEELLEDIKAATSAARLAGHLQEDAAFDLRKNCVSYISEDCRCHSRTSKDHIENLSEPQQQKMEEMEVKLLAERSVGEKLAAQMRFCNTLEDNTRPQMDLPSLPCESEGA